MSYYAIILFLIFAASCDGNNNSSKPGTVTPVVILPPEKPEPVVKAVKKIWSLNDFYSNDKALAAMVDSIYSKLSPAGKASQMIMIATSEYKGIGVPFPMAFKLYISGITGSVLFLKGRRKEFAREIALLNKASKEHKMIPPVFACDCEPSLFHKKFTDADSLTPAAFLTSVQDVRQMALLISAEMKKMGIHWNFAPVADISENKEIIDTRSFGDNDSAVVEKSIAFIKATENNGVATSVKHFPGHGAVKGDSHKNLVYIDSAFRELDNFSVILQKGNPISVMVGHIAVRNIPGQYTDGLPATLSEKLVTGLLKDSIGFKGIVITDAMNMKAVKNIDNAGWKAVMAGNDLVLIPEKIQELHQKIMKFLAGNSKIAKRLSVSIKKIIRLKICLGLFNNSLN